MFHNFMPFAAKYVLHKEMVQLPFDVTRVVDTSLQSTEVGGQGFLGI